MIAMFDEQEFPRMPPETNQTETLYNDLLGEIMSLQLLYQMQELSLAFSVIVLTMMTLFIRWARVC